MAAGTGERVDRVAPSYTREGSNERATSPYRVFAPAVADPLDIAAPLAAGALLRTVAGRQTVYVRGLFTVGLQTARVMVVFYSQAGTTFGAVVGHTEATLIGSTSGVLDGGLSAASPIPFDAVSENYEVRLITPPALGDLTLYTWEE